MKSVVGRQDRRLLLILLHNQQFYPISHFGEGQKEKAKEKISSSNRLLHHHNHEKHKRILFLSFSCIVITVISFFPWPRTVTVTASTGKIIIMKGGAVAVVVADRAMVPAQSAQKEWPAAVVRILVYLILLGSGLVFGIVATFHTNRYFLSQRTSAFFPADCDRRNNLQGSAPVNGGKPQKNGVAGLELKHWISPVMAMHNMSDEELLWRASMVPERPGFPFQRVPKIAFMFLTRGPLPFMPLWEKFLKGHQGFYSIYVHALPSFVLDVPFSSPFYKRQIPSQAVQWGHTNMCDAERRLLANALLDFSNERFVLLSESGIPVVDFKTAYDYLINSKHSFVHSFDDPTSTGRGRYSPKMAPVVTIPQWRKGSQWFELNRNLAISVVSDDIYYPVFKQFCVPPCYGDEHYLPTFVTLLHARENANRSVTWVDWSRGGSHPATFGKGDITEAFIKKIRAGKNCKYNHNPTSLCHLFARKFSASALEPLLNISSTVLGF